MTSPEAAKNPVGNTISAPDHSKSTSSGGQGKRKREIVLVACNRCRRLKVRCDNIRPSCITCRRINVTCEYDTDHSNERRSQAVKRQVAELRTAHSDVDQSLDWLRRQSPGTVLSCVERLRDATDLSAELCSVVAQQRSQRRSLEIPAQEALISDSHSIKDTQTAELLVHFPQAFPWLSEPRKVTAKWHEEFVNNHDTETPDRASSFLQQVYAHRRQIQNEKSSPLPEVCDTRLYDLNVSFWTTVDISDKLAGGLISSYLRVEQPIYGFFDPELFLEDLVTENTRNCSPLLVNSVLFWTCSTFGPVYPCAPPLAKAFLKAAQRLLDVELNNDNALNVASLMILGISAICYGKDALAKGYTMEGVQMAERLGLMGERRCTMEQFEAMPPDTLRMSIFAAWGAFNFSTVYLCHFHDTTSGTYTKRPPLLPPPDSSTPSHGRGPSASTSAASTASKQTSFPHFCRFWCIAHAIATGLYSCPGPIYQHLPLAFAEWKFRSLLEWAQSLPREVARSNNMPHNVAEMHICYHATIMDLFRPFLATGERLSTFATSPRRPEAIFQLSFSHLRALTSDYYTSHAGLLESHTISWVHGPLYVAPAILHYDRSDGWRVAFLSCMEAFSDLLRAHPMVEAVIRSLLGMAVAADVFSIEDAVEYLDYLLTMRTDASYTEIPETGFVVDQDLAMEDRAAAVGDALVQRFDELLFREDFDFRV